MPSYLHPSASGASIVFTVALVDRRSRLLVDEVAVLRTNVRMIRDERPFRFDAGAVLPKHLHCIWTLPEGDADYSLCWKEIKTRFTKSFGLVGRRSALKIAKGEAGLRQRRFREHHIRDRRDFFAPLRYCWWNPAKHGLIGRAMGRP